MSTAHDYADTLQFRLAALANEERRLWKDNKERAIERLARKLRATPRQVERWLTPGALKDPKVSLWFRVEELWTAIETKYEATCERLEAGAREHNTETGAAQVAREDRHADREIGGSGGAGMGRTEASGLVDQDRR